MFPKYFKLCKNNYSFPWENLSIEEHFKNLYQIYLKNPVQAVMCDEVKIENWPQNQDMYVSHSQRFRNSEFRIFNTCFTFCDVIQNRAFFCTSITNCLKQINSASFLCSMISSNINLSYTHTHDLGGGGGGRGCFGGKKRGTFLTFYITREHF